MSHHRNSHLGKGSPPRPMISHLRYGLPLREWFHTMGNRSHCRPNYLTMYTFPDQKKLHPTAKRSTLDEMDALHSFHQYGCAYTPRGIIAIQTLYDNATGSMNLAWSESGVPLCSWIAANVFAFLWVAWYWIGWLRIVLHCFALLYLSLSCGAWPWFVLIVLLRIALPCFVLLRIALQCFELFSIVLYCFVLLCIASIRFALFYIELHWLTLYCSTLLYFTLFQVTLYHFALLDFVFISYCFA